jgi:hypothetical protein
MRSKLLLPLPFLSFAKGPADMAKASRDLGLGLGLGLGFGFAGERRLHTGAEKGEMEGEG